MSIKQHIEFTLNGRPRSLDVPVTMSALTMLRDELHLSGTKYACGEGECGACTIIIDGKSGCSCLMFAVDFDGRKISTIEDATRNSALSKIADALVKHGAVQCGFCTPGMVMQAKNILDKNPGADRKAIERGIEGNICRCTGYKKIVDAISELSNSAMK